MLRFQVNNSAIGLSPALLAQEEALAMMHSASDGMLASGLALSTTLIAQNGMNRAEEMRLLEVMVSAFNAAILVMLYGSYGVHPLQLFAAHNGLCVQYLCFGRWRSSCARKTAVVTISWLSCLCP